MQILLNGLLSGLQLALFALAFALVYRPLRILHIAVGGLYTLSPFITWFLLAKKWPWPVAVAATIIVIAGLAIAIEAFNHGPLRAKGASPGVHMVSSLGLFIVFKHLAALSWGDDVITFRTGVARTFSILGSVISEPQLVGGAVALTVLVVFFVALRWSELGLRLRALTANDTELALRGYSLRQLRFLCFGTSGALCAVSALLPAYDAGFSPESGLAPLVFAILATVIAGRHSFHGAALGGLIIGILRSELSWQVSARWHDAVMVIVLVALLLLLPRGLAVWEPRVGACR